MPFACRKSIFFNREDIRDLIFKGYIIVYKVDKDKGLITVFGFSKYKDEPFNSYQLELRQYARVKVAVWKDGCRTNH